VDDTFDELELKDASFYTHLDLAYGFWQVRVRDQDIHKTLFQTYDGLMELVAMPFGLCNAPATFQCLRRTRKFAVCRGMLRQGTYNTLQGSTSNA
jgi:hypothetical protein